MRGRGLFNLGSMDEKGPGASEQPKPDFMPDDVAAVLCELHAELRARHGESVCDLLPKQLTPKERGQIKKLIQPRFNSQQITTMIRVLVWDWEEARVAFWPKFPGLRLPNVGVLIALADYLVQYTASGIPSSSPASRGRYGYAARYLRRGEPPRPPTTLRGVSLDDLL